MSKKIREKIQSAIDQDANRLMNEPGYAERMGEAAREITRIGKTYDLPAGFFFGFAIGKLRKNGVPRAEAEALFDECWKLLGDYAGMGRLAGEQS